MRDCFEIVQTLLNLTLSTRKKTWENERKTVLKMRTVKCHRQGFVGALAGCRVLEQTEHSGPRNTASYPISHWGCTTTRLHLFPIQFHFSGCSSALQWGVVCWSHKPRETVRLISCEPGDPFGSASLRKGPCPAVGRRRVLRPSFGLSFPGPDRQTLSDRRPPLAGAG